MTRLADLAGLALAAWLVVGLPLSAAHWRAVTAAVASEPQARLACYRGALRRLAVIGLTAGAALGLGQTARTPPGLADLPRLLLAVAGIVAVVVAARRAIAPAARPLLPGTAVERRLFGLVAVAAAIVEELAYRAFLPGALLLVVPGLTVPGAVGVATLAFAAAHAYQGPRGFGSSLVGGAGLALLYAATGGLVLPVLAHAALDLRLLPISRRAAAPLTAAQSPSCGSGRSRLSSRAAAVTPGTTAVRTPSARTSSAVGAPRP